MSRQPQPTLGLGVRKAVEGLLPPAVLRIAFEPCGRVDNAQHLLRTLIARHAFLRDLRTLHSLHHGVLGPEVLHVEEATPVQDNLFLPVPSQRHFQRLKRNIHLNVVLGAIHRAHAFLADIPLNLLADLRLLEQRP